MDLAAIVDGDHSYRTPGLLAVSCSTTASAGRPRAAQPPVPGPGQSDRPVWRLDRTQDRSRGRAGRDRRRPHAGPAHRTPHWQAYGDGVAEASQAGEAAENELEAVLALSGAVVRADGKAVAGLLLGPTALLVADRALDALAIPAQSAAAFEACQRFNAVLGSHGLPLLSPLPPEHVERRTLGALGALAPAVHHEVGAALQWLRGQLIDASGQKAALNRAIRDVAEAGTLPD